ncbi:MAG: hypothetical protein C4314_07570 [Thermoflexus sp.]
MGGSHPSPRRGGEVPMGRTATLLIIEDEPETVAVLKAYFQAQGYRVLAAASGEEALAMAREHTPDVILLDIRLPDIDGFEVFRRLRTHRRTEGIPVIFLTERRGRQDRLAGLELGAYDYIPKPFSLQELRARVQNILRRSQAGPAFDFLTGLPGLPLILEHLEEQLGRTGWAAWLIGLEGLEAFGEHYGFVARDDAIRAVGLLLAGVNHEGGEGLFLGHLGEGLFLMTGEALGEKALSRLQNALPYFYPLQELEEDPAGLPALRIVAARLMAAEGPFAGPEAVLEALRRRLAPVGAGPR